MMTQCNNSQNKSEKFARLRTEIMQCDVCKAHLPYPPTPVVSIYTEAKIVIIGQAPGVVAHNTKKPWNDNSGKRLRQWLGIDENTFYDNPSLTLMPMGFCFPGYKNNADAPPRKECAPLWHPKILDFIQPELTILVGRYAQNYYAKQHKNLTEAVKEQGEKKEKVWVLPHPSGRNNRWLAKNPWFEESIIPTLQARIRTILAT